MPVAEPRQKPLVYSHPECGYCPMVVDQLKSAGTEFDEIDLSRHPEEWAEVERISGGRTVPVLINTDGSVEVGFHGIGCAF
ncbi:MAG: glutaredoxin [Chloroflexi bacterium]|nr:glutaredoxin [Chloroflexota bacterium]MCH8223356.1 glutaredoxin [Chloroflexota bacterium]